VFCRILYDITDEIISIYSCGSTVLNNVLQGTGGPDQKLGTGCNCGQYTEVKATVCNNS
jgi:hypothetical protein